MAAPPFGVTPWRKLFAGRTERRFPMRGLMISGFVAVALLAIATTMLWSHSSAGGRSGLTVTMSLQDAQNATDVNKLPIEEFDDQTMVYSKARR
jgi:hypothetical protein